MNVLKTALEALRYALPYALGRRNQVTDATDLSWVRNDIEKIKEAISLLEKSPDMPKAWQPISIAPRGIEILVYVPTYRKKVMVGKLNKSMTGDPIWVIDNQFGFDIGRPKYWQHLPEEPEE